MINESNQPRIARVGGLRTVLAPALLAALLASVAGAHNAAAASNKPVEKMAVAEAAVARANSSSTSADAAGELQIAIARLASARDAMSSRDYQHAGELAEKAEVDAEVAESHAYAVRSARAARESSAAATALSQELERKMH